MRKPKCRALVASNSQKRRHHLLGQLVNLNYQASCTVVSDGSTRQSALRVPRPDIILYDLCDGPHEEAMSTSKKLAARLQCPVLYITKSWDQRGPIDLDVNGVIPSEKISSVPADATSHELDLAIENRILKSLEEENAISRQHEKWSFEAMGSALSVTSNFEQSTSAILGILGTALNASCAIVQESKAQGCSSYGTSLELASSGTRLEPPSERAKRLSSETMNSMQNLPYLHIQRIKNTKTAIESNISECLWMPRSALVTNIAPRGYPRIHLCTWWDSPHQHTDSELRVTSFAAIFLGIACVTNNVNPPKNLFDDRQWTPTIDRQPALLEGA
jgi:hypothetical protein